MDNKYITQLESHVENLNKKLEVAEKEVDHMEESLKMYIEEVTKIKVFAQQMRSLKESFQDGVEPMYIISKLEAILNEFDMER